MRFVPISIFFASRVMVQRHGTTTNWLPCRDSHLQETIKKTDGSGKLLPEMILICNNLRNNLQHPNEYLRGVTLRFLCRIHEEDILEPLVPSILSCLDHRKTFVRRNAVLAVHAVAKLPKGDVLIPDSAEIVDHFLRQEEDPGARRNAFVFLSQRDEDRALQYLFDTRSSVAEWHDTLQLAALQLVRGASRSKPEHKGTFVQVPDMVQPILGCLAQRPSSEILLGRAFGRACEFLCAQVVLALIQSPSASVVFEAASVLTALSLAPSAVRAVAGCYVQLLVSFRLSSERAYKPVVHHMPLHWLRPCACRSLSRTTTCASSSSTRSTSSSRGTWAWFGSFSWTFCAL